LVVVEKIEARQPRPEEAAVRGLTEAQQVLEVTRIAYTTDGVPVGTVINVFLSQQWWLSCEWTTGWVITRMHDLPRHSVSVTGVVFRDDGRVLAIQRRDDGRWVPPGGVLELAESPDEGFAREVLEETGLKVGAERLTGVYRTWPRE
jgi:NUDIX domain